MIEQQLLNKLREAETMPELDALRKDTVAAMEADGTKETFDRVQTAFRKAKSRLQRIPLFQRAW